MCVDVQIAKKEYVEHIGGKTQICLVSKREHSHIAMNINIDAMKVLVKEKTMFALCI